MAKRKPRIVIDASVGRAAGRKKPTHPTSIHCRNFLDTFKKRSFQIVITPEIRVEWTKHARKWLKEMYARKCVKDDIGDVNDTHLRQQICGVSRSEKERQKMEKDFLLLEAALATDKLIVSLDEDVRNLFRNASQTVRKISPIVWVNPDKENETVLVWLKSGAPAEEQRQLGYVNTKVQ